jgi:NADH:ubiquinone oxidoreductase subunit 4 (subunit M)
VLGSLFLLLSILAMSSIVSTIDLDTLFKGNFIYLTQLFLFYGIFIAFAVKLLQLFFSIHIFMVLPGIYLPEYLLCGQHCVILKMV